MSGPSIEAGSLFSVKGLNVVVTGGGSGLGAYMARALATNGASKVFVLGRRQESLDNIASSLSSSHPDVIIPVVCDVTSKHSLSSARDLVASQTPHIDVLVANSGVTGPSVPVFESDKTTPLPLSELAKNMFAPEAEDIASTFLVNVVGVQLTVAAFLPLLEAANQARPAPPTAENFRPRPQIVTTGSIAAFNRRPLGNLSYGPSKAGVVHLTKQLATLLVPYDIRVNCIAPGMYLSEMTDGFFRNSNTLDTHNVEGSCSKDFCPATRTGDEQDMAGAILYLCSRAGAYINGNILVTDGGRLGVMPASY